MSKTRKIIDFRAYRLKHGPCDDWWCQQMGWVFDKETGRVYKLGAETDCGEVMLQIANKMRGQQC